MTNILVDITDPNEFHCFRIVLNPAGHEPRCPAAGSADRPCSCRASGQGTRIEIMLHARSMVDLIGKCSAALCEWQAATTGALIQRMTGLSEDEARRRGLMA